MKKNAYWEAKCTRSWCSIFTAIFIFNLLIVGTSIKAQSSSNFKLRYHTEHRGGIIYVSNSILGCNNCSDVLEAPPKGKGDNNNNLMQYIDIDQSDDTFNSSSADLDLADCSSVTFAGLYWGGSISNVNPKYKDRSKVKLKLPGKTEYLDLIADEVWNGQCFKDITSVVNSNSQVTGTYMLANIVLDEGKTNLDGGWTIVIVFKNNLMQLRDLSVFDGLSYIESNTKVDFPVSGFSAPPVGPVNLDFGFVTYEGDRGGTGDYLAINNQRVFDSLHEINNIFNSSITNGGEVVKTRKPAYNNTLGYDASIIHLENSEFKYLRNSDTKATITFKTDAEHYSVGVLTAAIDIYNPNLLLSHNYTNDSRRSASVGNSEVVEMRYRVKNIGNDRSKKAVFSDTIPALFDYVKNSLELEYNGNGWMKMTDAQDDTPSQFVKNGRFISVPLNDLHSEDIVKIRYKMKATSDLDLLRCMGLQIISKYGWIQYSGNVNSEWTNKVESAPVGATDDCLLKGPIVIKLEPPSFPVDTAINIYCSGTPVSDLHLPSGYTLYKGGDITFQHPLDKLGEPGVYKAYRKVSTGCEYSFNVIARADSVTIYSQPDNIEATVGSGVAFSVGVKGENVSFQWQVNKGSGSWDDIPGATERSLTIPKVTEEMDGYNYRLRVTTPCKDYLLSVKVVLSVKKQPVSKPSEEPEPQPEVKDENVGALFVPNAFMPASNTQELRNFVVKGHGLAKWQMTIFNKWDQVIWKTDVIGADGSPAESWDGKMFGADAPQGAYMWAIEAVFEDGKEWEGMSVRDAKPRKSGVVYLLR